MGDRGRGPYRVRRSQSSGRKHQAGAQQNTLVLYPFAIDGKNFAALDNIFTKDVVANYSAPLDVLTPLSTMQTALEASLASVTTHRGLRIWLTMYTRFLYTIFHVWSLCLCQVSWYWPYAYATSLAKSPLPK